MEELLDLYTDYLQVCIGKASATNLSALLDKRICHDKFTDLLSKNIFESKDLWLKAKPLVRKHQTEQACLIFDDTIIEKPYTDENPIVCWHFDHTTGSNVKGVNIITCLYHSQSPGEDYPLRVPIGYEIVRKDILYCDWPSRKEKRTSARSKNEMLRALFLQAVANQLKFKYVLADSWYASVDNMRLIDKQEKFFIFDMKSNRLAWLSKEGSKKVKWQRIDQMGLAENTPAKLHIKDLGIEVLVCRQVFRNENGTVGERYLVSNDLTLTAEQFKQLYKKRWSVEEQYKSVKQNCAIAKSPTGTERTQRNHFFAAMVAYIKYEQLKFSQHLNHFALKTKLHLAALKAAFKELANFKQLQVKIA